MTKVITCTGYRGTGSSALTDYLAEFENVCDIGNFEFSLLYDPNGISDLKYHMVDNFHRHNSGHALKKFYELIEYLSGGKLVKIYEKFFEGEFNRLSKLYINNLTYATYRGNWREDLRERSYNFRVRKAFYKKISYLFSKKCTLFNNILPKEITYIPKMLTEEEFLSYTKSYLDSLFEILNPKKYENIVLDQFLPSTNTNKYYKYYSNVKCIIVDRDPRDVFLLEKYVWKQGCVPSDVRQFCTWYIMARSQCKSQNNDGNILNINFESMIFEYDNTTKIINEFVGFDSNNHIKKLEIFNPNISINNTQLFKLEKFKKFSDEIIYIEKELSEFLYKFPETEIAKKNTLIF